MPGKDDTMDSGAVPCNPSGDQPSVSSVPIIDVHSENFQSLYPSILLAMKNSSFIALDTELSGLGDRRSMSASSIEDRYKAISIAARTRSVLSLGLSCFKLKSQPSSPLASPKKENESQEGKCAVWNYMVQTFNITLLCHDDYTVEPRSLQFLVDHGFDFNKQCSKGILYHRGNDKNYHDITSPSVRDLFSELLMTKVPVVFHNAIVDLIFLHQNLYCDLPFKLNSFVCNLSEMFSAGIYDTKFIIEYYMRMPASYLEYIFKRCLRQAMKSVSKKKVQLSFLDYPQSFLYVNYHDLGCHRPPTSLTYRELQAIVCDVFAVSGTLTGTAPPDQSNANEQSTKILKRLSACKQNHGCCKKGRHCPKSHNMELILDLDELKPTKTQRRKDRKRKREEELKSNETQEKSKVCRMTNDKTENSSVDPNESNGESNAQSHHHDGQQETQSIVSYDDDDDDDDSKDSSLTSEDVNSPQVINTENFKILSGDAETNLRKSINAGHTAGFDAFMTGYIFATAITQISGAQVSEELKISGGQLSIWHNKVYLTGKEVPLAVAKSNFACVSNFHKQKHKSMQEWTKV